MFQHGLRTQSHSAFISLYARRQLRREEGAALAPGGAARPGAVALPQFRRAWRKLGLRLGREEAAALFERHG